MNYKAVFPTNRKLWQKKFLKITNFVERLKE